MEKIAHFPEKGSKKRVVIIGGGFAGLKLARSINGKLFQVLLLDKNNFHQFQPLFYQVSTAGLEPSAISFPFRKIFQRYKDFHFRIATAQRVDPEQNSIYTDIGKIEYDYLVIASGCDTNYFGNKDLPSKVIPLKSVSDALYMRNFILRHWENAMNKRERDEIEKDLNIVIVGGGPTGVELAGTLAEMKRFILPKDYPELDFDAMKIILLEGGKKLLGGMSDNSAEYAKRQLEKLGVIVKLNTFFTSYENELVELNNGEKIPTKNVLWVAGVKANGLSGIPDSSISKSRRVIVNEYNQVLGFKNIFAIGDTAIMPTKNFPDGHPQLAPVAIQQAKNLAKNLSLIEKNKNPNSFRYRDKGVMATIGRNKAVAEHPFIRMKGFIAWVIWLFVHLMSILGSKNKLFVFIGWTFNYFTRDPALRILIRPKARNISETDSTDE